VLTFDVGGDGGGIGDILCMKHDGYYDAKSSGSQSFASINRFV
jgi:hypothetical protein